MCTAVTYHGAGNYFGRNLDYEHSFNESVTITPRNYPLSFRKADPLYSHFAMIGMATVVSDYPLYFDATNEKGLSMAGLNFPDNAVYFPEVHGKDNITPFELIPWILGQCSNTNEAIKKIQQINLINISFNKAYPLTPLHWIIADPNHAIAVESTQSGIQIYDDPVGVLTNNPPFPYHIYNLTNYMHLTKEEPINCISTDIPLMPYSRGMGAMGLPGDYSSSSRFIKAAFIKLNSAKYATQAESIRQFFHILSSVAQIEGCVKVGNQYEKTIYSSCCNMDTGDYYYTTYSNSQITGISMNHIDLDCSELISYPLDTTQRIRMEN